MTSEAHSEAHRLHRAGLPITLSPVGSKKPLGEGWDKTRSGTAWQNKEWSLREFDRAFKARGELNPGVLYGPRSRLLDIEYDGAGGEAELSGIFGDYMPIAPTFKSKRGPHRIFSFDDDLNRINKATINVGVLEFKLGSTAMPATHFGRRRKWKYPS